MSRYQNQRNDVPESVVDIERKAAERWNSRWLESATIGPGNLSVKSGGSITVDGKVTVKNGSIILRDGQVSGDALEGFLEAKSDNTSATNFSVGTSWGDKCTISMRSPSWANAGICMVSASVIVVNTGKVDTYMRVSCSGVTTNPLPLKKSSNNSNSTAAFSDIYEVSDGSVVKVQLLGASSLAASNVNLVMVNAVTYWRK